MQLKRLFAFACLALISANTLAKNPIVPNKGLNDPHVRIFNNKAYVYASHDKSIDNKAFVMEDWWIWSSPDLVNWTKEAVLKPENTYIGKPFSSAWATDAAYRDGKYYMYFSEANKQTGVVVGDTPTGPWKDVLGKPLLTHDMTPTHEYDISVIEDKGVYYLVWGVWDYYIARLNDDMISLAEQPKKITIKNPVGPYGEGTTDDKPFLHKRNGKFYLSWGVFYAMADNVYGPYEYKGALMNEDSFAPGYAEPTWPHGFLQGRHGSFFEWHNQWYFAYCDISQTGNRYFRDTFISYVHYKDNGEMAPIRVDGIGVGEYDANNGKIEAEDFFAADNAFKQEHPKQDNNFVMRGSGGANSIHYPNVKNLNDKKQLTVRIAAPVVTKGQIEVRTGAADGKLIATIDVEAFPPNVFSNFTAKLPQLNNVEDLYFTLDPVDGPSLYLDYFIFH